MTEQDKKDAYVVETILPLVYSEWNQRIRHHETRLIQIMALGVTMLIGLTLLSDRIGLLSHWSLIPIGINLVPIGYNLVVSLHAGRLLVHSPSVFLKSQWQSASLAEFRRQLMKSAGDDDGYITKRLEDLAHNVRFTAILLAISGSGWVAYLLAMMVCR